MMEREGAWLVVRVSLDGVRVCAMRIVSWNVHGLNGLEKRKEVKELVREKVPFVLCIQETKLQLIDDFLCISIWGPSSHGYFFSPSVGESGGLVTIWDTTEVAVWMSCRGDHFLMIHGRFITSNEEFYLFNVYAQCDRSAKQILWTNLTARVLSLGNHNVCLCGDFNSIRSANERRSVRGAQSLDEFSHFNEFIDECVLIDLPLCGRKFTRFKGMVVR
jgi:exonuclease III